MQPLPSLDEQRANATYEALLWALSRPGQIRTLPGSGEAGIVEALLDRECRVYASDPRLIPALVRSGAEVAELADADHAFLGTLQDVTSLATLRQGSDLYPDDGATVFILADLNQGAPVRLTGPGVDGVADLRVGGLPDGFWQERARVMRYPMGFEVFLLDQDRVAGIPRSTQVELL